MKASGSLKWLLGKERQGGDQRRIKGLSSGGLETQGTRFQVIFGLKSVALMLYANLGFRKPI